ncbi:DUF4083 domain-containing protein [Bacillus sp. LL01]|uniref:DUF4083 domain-containing protein n=1 Tax=Bacillus sp. LL01 TaxID=1665556 RepID=UPI000B14C137|nr:DUF4083 domain-containing protein [Bacillus sp. LL01]
MSEFHLGDALLQLFVFGLLVLILVLIVGGSRSFMKRRTQLDRIEEKIDTLLENEKRR